MANSANQPSSRTAPPWAEAEQLSAWRYSRFNWGELLNLEQFVASCPWRQCQVDRIHGRRCPVRCRGCIAKTTPLTVQARHREAEAARERAAEEARAAEDRAEEENPGLYRQDKLWFPHAPGVAVIRGDLLVDVASFFRDCDITVREHNSPNTNRSLKGKGGSIADAHDDTDIRRFFMRWTSQLQVQIDKFHSPPDTIDLEYPGERVLSSLRGAHGNAMCGLIFFLGSTGEPEAGRVDKKCSYGFHSALAFPDKDIRNAGDTSFRMVRIPNKPVPDLYDIMLRFDLPRGKKSAKRFHEKFSENVKKWTVRHRPFKDFYWGSLQNVPVEPSEDDEPNVPDPTESSESSDVTNLSEMSGSEDLSGIPMRPRERTACERKFVETQAQAARKRKLAEARAARSREMAEDQADRERRFAEVRAADLERHTKAIADRERRHAVQAARARGELPEAQADGEKRLAETQDDHEERHTKAIADREQRHAVQAARARGELPEAQADGEKRLAETQDDHEERYYEADDEGEEFQTGSGGTVSPEEGDSEDRLRRDITRLAPECLRRGGKI